MFLLFWFVLCVSPWTNHIFSQLKGIWKNIKIEKDEINDKQRLIAKVIYKRAVESSRGFLQEAEQFELPSLVVVVVGILMHCFKEPLIFVWSHLVLSRKMEVIDRLSHISRVNNIGVVHSRLLDTSSISYIFPSWFSVMGTCVIRCSLNSLGINSTRRQTWIRRLIRANKTPETVSRAWNCTRSGENFTEYIM